MWELFIHPSNFIFSIALCLMLFIGLLECALLLFTGGSQGIIEQFFADHELHSAQADIGIEQDVSLLTKTADWLGIGRVPLLIWLVVFLTSFALSGFILQAILNSLLGHVLTAWLAVPLGFMIAAPIVHVLCRILVHLIPSDETTAIYSDELIGRTAQIILGDARPNSPAQAKVKDQHGQTHYILVEPEHDEIYKQGQEVVLTQKTKVGFQANIFPITHSERT